MRQRKRGSLARMLLAGASALLLLIALSCGVELSPDGWPARVSPPVATDTLLHLGVLTGTLVVALALSATAYTVWRHLHWTRMLHRIRLAPSARLQQAAADLVPVERLHELATDVPFAGCIGWCRPAIYVSRPLLALPPEALQAALAHEEAHRRRRDPLRFALVHLAVRVLPGVALLDALAERVELRAEIRADRYARQCVSRTALAQALLVLAEHADLAPAHLGESATDLHRSTTLARGAWLLRRSGGAAHPRADAVFAERLRYLQLPRDQALPSWYPAGALHLPSLLPLLGRVAVPFALAMLLAVSASSPASHMLPAAYACLLHV